MASQWPGESQAGEEAVLQMPPGVDYGDSEAVWHYIENGLDRIMFEPTWGTDIPSLVGLYTAVHKYCTSQKGLNAGNTLSSSSHRGAHLVGEELYLFLKNYLHQYLGTIRQRFKSLSGHMLLNRYLDECAHYTNAAQIIDHVFRYLNRHWIKRELDEGKKSIYDVYTLHFVFWHNELFKEIAPLLVDAVSELVDKHHEEAMIEIGTSNAFIEFIVSLEPGGTEVSGFTREVYGNLLETPLRIALEASAYQDLPAFLYERPITTSTFIGGLARKEIEERLVTLVGHSGFDQRLPNGGDRDTGTVRLVTNDLVVVEADQKAVECSVLIKHLCTYFGKKIIARELIPLPSVTEPVLRKVLEWCEYHAHDADNTNIHSVASYNINSPGVDEWDRNYFDIDTDILFEIVLAANYLDIEQLLNGGCKAIANLIKGKTPEEIRETFNITNDFTPEEEEQIRLENEWSEDR